MSKQFVIVASTKVINILDLHYFMLHIFCCCYKDGANQVSPTT